MAHNFSLRTLAYYEIIFGIIYLDALSVKLILFFDTWLYGDIIRFNYQLLQGKGGNSAIFKQNNLNIYQQIPKS